MEADTYRIPFRRAGTITRGILPVFGAASALAIAGALFASATLSMSAAAAPALAPEPTPALTWSVDEVRGSFNRAGLVVDEPYGWGWLSPGYTSVKVHDWDGRIVLAMIYRDASEAAVARAQAERQELERDPSTSVAGTPHLVESHGRSAWRGNLALVQSSESQQNRLFGLSSDRANGVELSAADVQADALLARSVDADLLQALDAQRVDL